MAPEGTESVRAQTAFTRGRRQKSRKVLERFVATMAGVGDSEMADAGMLVTG